jgi:hypothetical protein
MNTKLQKKIMRRVYTAYVMRLCFGSRARHIALMALCAFGLVRLVSVVDVIRNFSSVTVGQAGDFIVSAFVHADMLTLMVLAVFVYAAIAFIRSGRMDGFRSPRFA